MNMHTLDESDFRKLFGYTHGTFNEYSGMFNKLKESINAKPKIPIRHQSKKLDKRDTGFRIAPRKKLSCADGLLFKNKSFREDIFEPQRVNRLKEMNKENLLLRASSREAITVQRKISSLSQNRFNINTSFITETEEDIQEHQNIFREEFLLPKNSILKDIDELIEINHITENQYRTLFKKPKRIYDSLSDEEALDEEINEAYYVEPYSKVRLTYDLVLFILVFYSMFSVPYQIAFYINHPELNSSSFLLNLVIDIVFIFDIILSFFTAYYDFEEKLVKFYYLMALHYIQTWFLIDFLSGIPINSILNIILMKCPQCIYTQATMKLYQNDSNINYNLFKMLRLLKAFKVFSTNSFIDKIISSVRQTIHVSKTIRLITTLLIFSMLMHLFACIVVFVGFYSYPNWISRLHLKPQDSFTVYIASFYFICTTVISIGYGDIITYNITERILNGFLLIVGLLIYSWTISTLTSYFISDDKILVEYRNKCIILEDIKVCYDNMSNELYSKIQRHLLYKLNSQKMDVNAIFNSLPIRLRNNLIIAMYKPIIDNFVFFKNYTSSDFIIQVILSLKPLLSLKGEKLLNDGDVLDEMFFVKKGKLILEFPLPMVVNENNKNSNTSNNNKLHQNNSIPSTTANTFYSGGAQALGGATLYESCGGRLTYAFQTMVSFKGALPFIKQNETRHYVLSDFDFQKQMELPKRKGVSKRRSKNFKNIIKETKPQQQYVKLIEIRQNEHFGDVLMFLTKRSPLRVRVKTKTAELFSLKKTDAVEISNSFPKIWKQIIKKSLFNMKQIYRLINKNIKFFFIHHEGTKYFVGRTLIPCNPDHTIGGGGGLINENSFILQKHKHELRKQFDKKKKNEEEIDTSNSELESIPDVDNNDNNKLTSSSSGSDIEEKHKKQKNKITKLLETFEEETLRQSIQKIQKQSIIYKNFDELLQIKDDTSDENDITSTIHKKKNIKTIHKQSNCIQEQNQFPKAKSSHIETIRSISSSSGSSILPNNNNNNNNKESPSSYSSSSSDQKSQPLRNKTYTTSKNRNPIYKKRMNKTSIWDSRKSSTFTYKDLKLKQPAISMLDELVEKKASHISIHFNNNHILNDNDSSDSKENVYSEFHSNEDELKDNLIIKRPPLDSYDPFTYYDKCNFGLNDNEDNNDVSYGNLINSFNNVCFTRETPTKICSSMETNNNGISSFKPKFIFSGMLGNNNTVNKETISKNKQMISKVNTIQVGPTAPTCKFTFSHYTHHNENKINSNYKDKDPFGDSSSSESLDDIQKRSLVKLNKPSSSISPKKGKFFQRSSTKYRIKKKETFSYEISSNFDRLKTIGRNNKNFLDCSNMRKELIQISPNIERHISRNKSSTRELLRISSKNKQSNIHKDQEDINFSKKKNTLLLNISCSSDDNEKGKDDLEVEKIMGMGMTPNLSPAGKKRFLFKQILTPSTYSNRFVTELNGNEGYKKKFFGMSPTFKKRGTTIAKCGTLTSNALERITSNIQENSSNLNEPKEFYSNLFAQFLDGKNVYDDEEMKKIHTFKEPLKIQHDKEELEQNVIKSKSKKVGNKEINSGNNVSNYNITDINDKRFSNIRRNNTLFI